MPASDLSSCMVLFSTPPAGGAGGSELSDRARPERQRGTCPGRRERGVGGGEVHLNNDGSVIPFCSFPNIKSHMKFLA